MRISIIGIMTLLLFHNAHSQNAVISSIDRKVEANKKQQAKATFSINGDVFEQGYSYTVIYITDSINKQLSEVRYWKTNPTQAISFYYEDNTLLKADVTSNGLTHAQFYFSNHKPLATNIDNGVSANALLTKAKAFLADYRKRMQ